MTSIQELIAQKEALERQIEQAQRVARADAISKVKSLMSEYGLTVADLSSRASPAKPTKEEKPKVAAKYRNRETGETWTGRGLKPRWLASALSQGKTLEDFAV